MIFWCNCKFVIYNITYLYFFFFGFLLPKYKVKQKMAYNSSENDDYSFPNQFHSGVGGHNSQQFGGGYNPQQFAGGYRGRGRGNSSGVNRGRVYYRGRGRGYRGRGRGNYQRRQAPKAKPLSYATLEMKPRKEASQLVDELLFGELKSSDDEKAETQTVIINKETPGDDKEIKEMVNDAMRQNELDALQTSGDENEDDNNSLIDELVEERKSLIPFYQSKDIRKEDLKIINQDWWKPLLRSMIGMFFFFFFFFFFL